MARLLLVGGETHGVGVAWSCAQFGGTQTQCHVFLPERAEEKRAERIRSFGGIVHREGKTYEAALAAAKHMSEREGWTLVQDVSWDGYMTIPQQIWEGWK